jgi:hypothetical protein
MQFLPSVTELVVAQCYYLDFDDRNRQRPIYVYLNSTGCINDQVSTSEGTLRSCFSEAGLVDEFEKVGVNNVADSSVVWGEGACARLGPAAKLAGLFRDRTGASVILVPLER